MFERYSKRIKDFCEESGIEIPIGFCRHDAKRFVAIDMDHSPPKLVATTWSTEQDTASFLLSSAAARRIRLLDFKERRELMFNDQNHLVRGERF
ncbi:hypothetical protein [Variovorax sp. KK3]|uniref:hypothetical protein n=1 Tax=Variovorax sp. KK3 TaxID=1855728 RepID=UPI00097CAACC|nr:hypothetical protein [Variovorax sp. KK3]